MSDAAETPALDGIAIVGMAGRFPGARSVDELWANLCGGVESISVFTDEELLAAGVEPAVFNQPNYVRARGALNDAEYFDAAFFGHSPTVAALMDPQHRLFLECAWTALEHAGYDPDQYSGRVGVFGGESMNTYLLNNVISHMRMVASVDSLQASIGNDKDSLTTEVAYKLNLTGPTITIQSASSTSLVAVHVACQSLLNYECDMGLAGGVSIHFPEQAGYLYQEGGATSSDGHCRAFDAQSDGFVNGHGAGVVVLKRLEDALDDGDTIYAVIRGSAVNNDGAIKVSYMAPSVDGQAGVIAMAQAVAGVEPDSISYIEAHGTGTKLGDPIEIAALTQAFRAKTDRTQFCAIGSLKPNIGHLDTAAGVAGLIKAALALKHRQIPASINYSAPNPRIDFANSPFYVNTKLVDWQTNGAPRRAGVSSFGMGGTNAHAVLEEGPQLSETDPAQEWHLLTISAKTPAALDARTAELGAFLQQHPASNLADVAYTLRVGRRSFGHRRTLVARTTEDAASALSSADPERLFSSYQEPGERPVVFMFSGQGAQYTGMAADLYRTEPAFRAAFDECTRLLKPHMPLDLRDVVFGGPARDTTPLTQTQYVQPALFAVEYALARLWMSWGVQPGALVGHSVGEYVAACLAGVFSLEDALALIATRGRLMQGLPAGSMLAVPLSEQDVQPLLNDQIALAAINGPSLSVVSGPTAAIEQLEAQLSDDGLNCRRLHTSHAFHSAMMEPILPLFTEAVGRVKRNTPTMPFISNVTGTWITAEQATDPHYWARHLRQAVRFAPGLDELLRDDHTVLLEIGPGQTLATLARQHGSKRPTHTILNSLRHPNDTQPDRAFLLGTLGRLWLAGVTLDAPALFAGQNRRRIPLPTYPFERQRYWLEPLKMASIPAPDAPLQKRADIGEWFTVPVWKSTGLASGAASAGRWLLFADDHGLVADIGRRLAAHSGETVVVRPGTSFARDDERLYTINPGTPADYTRLLADLRDRDLLPASILHGWSLGPTSAEPPAAAEFRGALQHGFLSLLLLTQALGNQQGIDAAHLVVLSSGLHSIAGEATAPANAALNGLSRVIPQEYPHLTCQTIDVALPAGGWQQARLAEQVLAECLHPAPGRTLAYRANRRMEQDFAPAPLPDAPTSIRTGGTYLITGGFGGIGLALARHLATTAQANLALLARSPLPPRSEWANAGDDETGRRIRSVLELEQLGATVLPLTGDVTDVAQMREAVQQIDQHFGELHGVIHAAGLVQKSFFQVIQEADLDAAQQHFAAKVYGSLALAQALEGRTLDFCMLMSSLSSVLGGLGYGAYAAANSAMDALAVQYSQHSPTPWVSVNWDAWELTEAQRKGMTAQQQQAHEAMTGAEGSAAFERILAAGIGPQVLVSTTDLHTRIARWVAPAPTGTPAAEQTAEPAQYHPRPNLPNPYIAPRTPTEQAIAELWQTTLGVQQVGIHDNFFDLGGNSLTGINVIGKLKARFNTNIPTVSLYEGPTVSALAKLIDQEQDEQPVYEQSRNRGERRREKRLGRLARTAQADDDDDE